MTCGAVRIGSAPARAVIAKQRLCSHGTKVLRLGQSVQAVSAEVLTNTTLPEPSGLVTIAGVPSPNLAGAALTGSSVSVQRRLNSGNARFPLPGLRNAA